MEAEQAEAYVAELTAAIEAGAPVPVTALAAAGARVEAAKVAIIEERGVPRDGHGR